MVCAHFALEKKKVPGRASKRRGSDAEGLGQRRQRKPRVRQPQSSITGTHRVGGGHARMKLRRV